MVAHPQDRAIPQVHRDATTENATTFWHAAPALALPLCAVETPIQEEDKFARKVG
jgi:hypothetical protein